MTLAAFLVAMVGPIMARILSALGLSMVVLGGLTASAGGLKSLVISNLGSLPSAGVQLGGLFGFWEALGIVFGGLTFVITWKSTAGFWALAAK
jgi:hypothetical protein